MSCLREKRGKFELAQIEFKVHPRDKIPRPPNNAWNKYYLIDNPRIQLSEIIVYPHKVLRFILEKM